MKKWRLLVIGIVFILTACSDTASEIESEMNDDNTGTECIPEFPDMDVSYNNYVGGIMNKYCIECHHTGNSQGPGDFTTYSGVVPYAEKFLVRVIQDNADMPQGNAPLPKAIRDSLNVWVRNCVPLN